MNKCPFCGQTVKACKPNPNVVEVYHLTLIFRIPCPDQTYLPSKEFYPYLDVFKEKAHKDTFEAMKLYGGADEYDERRSSYSYQIYARNEQEVEEAKELLATKYNEAMQNFIAYLQHCMVDNAMFPEKKTVGKNRGKMIRFRWHRGGLAESLETTVRFSSKEELEKYIRDDLAKWSVEGFKVTYKYVGYDDRCKWNTWYVCIDGKCIGMAELKPIR